MRRLPISTLLFAAIMNLCLLSIIVEAQPAAKIPLTYAAYDSWNSITGAAMSRDGKWVIYALVPEDGDGELAARNTETGVEYRSPRGLSPSISADSRFVAFAIKPLKADLDKAKKDKKKPDEMPKSGLGILSLADGKITTIDRVAKFQFPENNGRYLAYLMEAPPKAKQEAAPKSNPAATTESSSTPSTNSAPAADKKAPKKHDPGSNLIVMDLSNNQKTTISDVVEFAWNKLGTRLAYTVSSETPGNDGAFVRQMESSETTALLIGKGEYKSITFDEKGDQIAFLSNRDEYEKEAPSYKLYVWNETERSATEIVSASTANMPKGKVVSENAPPSFTKDGSMVRFGLAAPPKPAPKDPPDLINVDIWNWKDGDLQPNQKVQADAEKKRSYTAVWHVREKRLVPLASEDMPKVELTDGASSAIGISDRPYMQLSSWDGEYADYYLVNLKTGSREKILEKSPHSASLSPGGNYLIYFDANQHGWMVYRLRDKKTANLTAGMKVNMADELNDRPDFPQPYGVAGWTTGDRSVLIYDHYDIWEIQPFGHIQRNLTSGRSQRIMYRYPKLDPDEKTIPTGKPLLLTSVEEQTKAAGYSQIVLSEDIADTALPSPVRLLREEKSQAGLIKAKESDAYLFTQQRYEDFPDLWVTHGGFSKIEKISNANPQQSKYVWGRAQLVDFNTSDGKPLKAVLIKPDNFDPSKKYPLMVYIYERLSDTLNTYHRPGPGTNICISRYVSNGYVVLTPDICYTSGYPGASALKCVLPAIQKVESYGYIDPNRVGIQGHSWGGYEITYMITRTDIFRAAEAGASVSNMISAYGGIRWGTGVSRASQYEHGQSRIGGPPWERPLQYIENSPIFWVDKVTTPYLSIANDGDGAVPWYQGIEFFSAMRRLGKEAYLFNYNGEDHGLKDRENMKHWTVHLDEFFDHFLLDKPLPDWMDKGVPYLERGKRNVKPAFGE